MNFKYKNYAKKLCKEAFLKFYIKEKIYFKKSKNNNDIFFNPIDIGDNTIPNGNDYAHKFSQIRNDERI